MYIEQLFKAVSSKKNFLSQILLRHLSEFDIKYSKLKQRRTLIYIKSVIMRNKTLNLIETKIMTRLSKGKDSSGEDLQVNPVEN